MRVPLHPLHPDFLDRLLKNPVVPQVSVDPKKQLFGRPHRVLFTILFLALSLSMATAYYFYDRYHTVAVEQTELESVVALVGEHLMLPEGVVPRVGKIENTEAFTADPFLSQARVGDLVLFYPYGEQTLKAILWRPDAKKIVDVSLVTLPDLSE